MVYIPPTIPAIPMTAGRAISSPRMTTAKTGTATVSPVRFLTKDAKHYINYERLLLPLSEDGREVNMILGSCSPLDDKTQEHHPTRRGAMRRDAIWVAVSVAW